MSLALDDQLTPESMRLFIDHNDKPKARRPYAGRRNVVRILHDLLEHGPAKEKSGRATLVLRERLEARGDIEASSNGDFLNVLSMTLKDLGEHGLVARQMNGKRTFLIEASVDWDFLDAAGYGYDYVPKVGVKPPPPEPKVEVESPEPPPALAIVEHRTDPSNNVLELVDDSFRVDADRLRPIGYLVEASRLVAMAVSEWENPDTKLGYRLADVLEENDRLRRKLHLAEDRCHALSGERDGLRRAKQMLEANFDRLAKGSFDEAGYRRFKELDKLIRSAPSPTKAD